MGPSSTARCLTEDNFLKEIKEKKAQKLAKEAEKEKKRQGREIKKRQKGRKTRAAQKRTTEAEDKCCCGKCGKAYGEEEDELWINCEDCEEWFDAECAEVSEDYVPEHYFCDQCL